MNKIFAISLISSMILSLGCERINKKIELIQLEAHYPITLYLNKNYNKVTGAKLPIKIRLKSNSIFTQSYTGVDYEYYPYRKGIGTLLYVERKGKIRRIKQSKKKDISAYDIQEYVIYTRHLLDTSKVVQKNFESYIDKMISMNQDTLTIGTINDFKKNHGELLNTITNQDSIRLDLWQAKDVIIPVVW